MSDGAPSSYTHSPRQSLTLLDLPRDVLYRIISFASVPDKLRLLQTSTFFRNMMEERPVWSDAYRMSSLPRYPGPFPHQSTKTLKKALLTSAKVAQNSESEFVPTSTRIFKDDKQYIYHRFFLGRWYTGIDCRRRINCVDLDTARGEVIPTVIYRCDDGFYIIDYACLSTTSLEGYTTAFAVVLEAKEVSWEEHPFGLNHPTQQVIKLLKIANLDGPVLSLELIRTYPAFYSHSVKMMCAIGPRLLVVAGDSQLDQDKWLYIDLETFKPYQISLPPVGVQYRTSFICCTAHLLVIRSPYRPNSAGTNHTIFNAFAIPASGSDPQRDALKMTHHCQHPNIFAHISLLHDPTMDSWRREPRILLLANISDISHTSTFLGVVRLHLSEDRTIMCNIQNLYPRRYSEDFITFTRELRGSNRGLNARHTDDGMGVELDWHEVTLSEPDGLRSEVQVTHSIKKNFLSGWQGNEWVEGIDAPSGRVLFRDEDESPYVYKLVEFA
ncbi:hypothetical protein BJ138DRAFT_1142442 [Hygrophoropsis aurantiaca]|uniref:Uncharacterized protein n=1 Tax=Hygrophoropsis aurantiaca TaxID=72124 RepID=A0ACB8AS01_9AGAM|nr:hypothetical protein BJ138DRAFT_1142442 [Hygrophoropsis aurantiaca]